MFREIPRRGWALAADVVATSATATAAGAAAAFLVLVFFGVVAEEGFLGIWTEFDLDPVWRAGIGAAGIVVLVAGGVAALFTGLSGLATAGLLADAAERDRSQVAGWSIRRVLERSDPFEAFVGFAIVFLVLDVLGLVAVVYGLAETTRYNSEGAGEGFVALAVLLAAGLVTVLLLFVRKSIWESEWDARVARARGAWNAAIPKAIDAERRRRSRPAEPVETPAPERGLRSVAGLGWRIFTGVGGVAGAVFLVALYLRQPCRQCDERTYDHAGEAIIDVLARFAGPAALLALVGLALSLVALWAADVLRMARLARRAAEGTPAPPADELAAALTGVWPGRSAGVAIVATAWGVAAVALGVHLAGSGAGWLVLTVPATIVGALGVVLLVVSESRAAAVRNRLREAWSPGDVRPPEPEPERESAAVSGTE